MPAFLRGLGSVMGAVGTTVGEGLSRLNRRSLGAMEMHVRKLYVRLTNDLPPDMTWARLAGETGSELVTRTVRIFSDGIKVGGDPAAVGELASSFGQKVALLRASRSLVSNSFAFVVVPMHAALLGIILFVTEVVLIFGGKIAEVQEQNLDSDLIAEAGVSNAIVFAAPDAGFIRFLVVISIIMLTAANSFAPYAASGGHRYKIFNFAVIMTLISGVFYIVIPEVVQGLFASVAETPAAGGTPIQ
jgi:flagellar protein FlaJ